MRRGRALAAFAVVVGASACRGERREENAPTDRAVEAAASALVQPAPSDATPSLRAGAKDAGDVLDAASHETERETQPNANTEGWCTEGLDALDPSTCIVVPERLSSPRSLVIYLHGTIAPTGGTQKVVQSVVAKNARSLGFVAMMPRGVRGIGPNKIVDWWAWPTTAAAHAKYAKDMVRGWLERRGRLESRLGGRFEKTYVAGSSNGAYFLVVLALKGEIDADGFAALSGGSRGSWTKSSVVAHARPPFYVGYGSFDDTKPGPAALGDLLREASWPHKVSIHRIGHGANEVYLEEALTFWRSIP